MKRKINYKYFVIAVVLVISSCKMDQVNPNAASDAQVLTTREGIIALSVGLRQYYSTTGLSNTMVSPSVTAREMKGVATFSNVIELEEGGANVSTPNANVLALWSSMQAEMGMCENIINYAPKASGLDAGTLSGIMAQAYLFKATALTELAMAFEEANLNTSITAPVQFVPRAQVFAYAISLLDLGIAAVKANPISTTFTTSIAGPDFDLVNSLYAYEARINLIAGDNQKALDNANLVDLTKTSKFDYSTLSPNPLYTVYNITKSYFPRAHFGLADSLYYPGDNRLSFYFTTPSNVINGDTVVTYAGFGASQTTSIPVYTPDEIRLIQAEATLRLNGSLTTALNLINAVRTQTSGDPFGVNAGLPAYSGPVTYAGLLEEVYKQRCAELYCSGLKWEDTRRFNRPAPPANSTERNRIFYPYPNQERINNPNTPVDPAI
ncbi:RagB/SusD family nutrient uptake outer membrane protein [Mucilaginibacter sp. L196]|uniref:RagB/SusD family nutrient uptake outer membrane protein n=1 Tax=Mucilaginibacter sp. L196 TaxID=1641870 RepID=UPI00131D850A|nr:RagB/SusD family nutrient uptake outer membrane protein [Mucilaginibacter sp. L196]